jgi:hypothetical protein
MPAAAVPVLISAAATMYGANKAARTAREQMALSRQLGGRGDQLWGVGLPALQQSSNYYGQILGSRAGMRQAVAPEVAGINDLYKGARKGIEAGNLTGADKELAAAETNKQRVGQIGSLYPTARANAAGNLASIGQGVTGQSGNFTMGSLTGYSDIARQAGYDRESRNKWGYLSGQGVGNTIFDLIRASQGTNAKAGTLPSQPIGRGVVPPYATLPSVPAGSSWGSLANLLPGRG